MLGKQVRRVRRFVVGRGPWHEDAWIQLERYCAANAATVAAGERPEGLPYVEDRAPPTHERDVFVFFINGAKVRAPQGAMALMERLALEPLT